MRRSYVLLEADKELRSGRIYTKKAVDDVAGLIRLMADDGMPVPAYISASGDDRILGRGPPADRIAGWVASGHVDQGVLNIEVAFRRGILLPDLKRRAFLDCMSDSFEVAPGSPEVARVNGVVRVFGVALEVDIGDRS